VITKGKRLTTAHQNPW